MLKYLLRKGSTKLQRYVLEKSPDVNFLCFCEELDLVVYQRNNEYTLLWNDFSLEEKYEVTSFLHGEDIFYIQSRSDQYERCWIKQDGRVVYRNRENTISITAASNLSNEMWGIEIAEKVWRKALYQRQTRPDDWMYLIAYFHKYYCGQGLFILTDAEAEKINLSGAGIGIFTVDDSYPSKSIFYWSEREKFVKEFSQLTDYGMSGADQSPFYSKVPKDNFSLNNQILTRDRVVEWLGHAH